MRKLGFHSLAIVIAYLIVVAGFLSITSNLEINPDNRVYYAESNPRFISLRNFEEEFQTYSNVTFLLEFDETIKPSHAKQLTWITNQTYNLPGFIRHYSIENYPHIRSSADDIEITTTLAAACQPALQQCVFEGAEFDYLDEITRRLISPDLGSLALVAVLDIPISNHAAVTQAASQIKEIQAAFSAQFPQTNISYTGTVPMMQAFVDASQRDLGLLLPLSILVMFILVSIATGSLYFALVLGTVCLGGIICTLAVAKLLGLTLNSATSILPLALLIISTSSTVHLLTFISRRFLGEDSGDYNTLIQTAVNANRIPILLASLTTAFGFLTLCLVEIPPFREFGLLGALGVGINYFTVIYIVPEFLKLRQRHATFRFQDVFSKAINSYAKFTDEGKLPKKAILIASALACVGLLGATIDENYVEFFDSSHEFRKGADRLNAELSSPYHLDLIIDFGQESAAFEPINLQSTLDFQSALNAMTEVSNSLSFAQHIVRAKKSFAPQSKLDIGSETKETLEQYYLAYLLSLQEGQSPTEFLDVANQKARISLLLTNLSSRELRGLERAIGDAWKADYAEIGTITITGEAMPLAHISRRSILDMGLGLSASLLLLFIGALAITRNLRISLITTLSVLSPFMMSFGLWSWTGTEFGLATSLIVAVTLGIIVDDTIHFIYRFLRGRNQLELTERAAIGYAIHHSGWGIFASSVLLTCGFAILIFSTFTVNEYFGVGVCISIFCALMFTLMVLPTLLTRSQEAQ